MTGQKGRRLQIRGVGREGEGTGRVTVHRSRTRTDSQEEKLDTCAQEMRESQLESKTRSLLQTFVNTILGV